MTATRFVSAPRIAVMGMMSQIPVPGVIWQTMHYLIGLERLGFDVYYVEDNGITPRNFFDRPEDDGWARAATFVDAVMREFGFQDKWAIHAEHAGRRHFGLSSSELSSLYRSAALLINLHGNSRPRPEHVSTGRLVLLETDPVELQVQLSLGAQHALDYVEAHCAYFTFGENVGRPGCGVPNNDRWEFWPTRQPVVLDLWDNVDVASRRVFTTIGNWHQGHRQVVLDGATYHWSKDREFSRFIGLPARTGQRFELALSSYDDSARAFLRQNGWSIRAPFLGFDDLHDYRRFIASSAGEFTVAKDQNVRLRSGWFSDRSATYLAAGCPVVTQDTGFADNLPTGKGLFAVLDEDEAVAAIEEIVANPSLHRRGASEVAREHFDARFVLTEMLDRLGMAPRPARRSAATFGLPPELDIHTVSRWPTRVLDTTVAAMERSIRARIDEASAHASSRRSSLAPHISIVVPVRDNVVFTAMCLESVLADQDDHSFEIVVVDNGSTDETARYLAALACLDDRVRPVTVATNLGFAAGCNLGIREARGATIVLLNNDTVVSPGWLDRLIAHLDDDRVALVGATTNHTCNEAQVNVAYRTYAEMVEVAGALADERAGSSFDIRMLAMFCVAGRRETFEQVGALDEQYGLGMFEDDDYAERVRSSGLRLVCAEDVFVHHFGEVSLAKELAAEEYEGLFEGNRARFEEKWSRAWQPHGRRTDPAYERLVDRVRGVVERVLPADDVVLVVSKGDAKLVEHTARRAAHYPGNEDGVFIGEYPENSVAAVDILERQVAAGARHIVFPATALWWLDHYAGLRSHLEARYGEPVHSDDDCMIWSLNSGRPADPVAALSRLTIVQADEIARLREELASLHAIVAADTTPSRADAVSRDLARSVDDLGLALDRFMTESNASKRTRYLLLRSRLRRAVEQVTAPASVIAFISHGDGDLLDVDGREGWHLPRLANGQWTQGLPADDREAIEQLERVRALGADYLVLPSPYAWWLDHYEGLRTHLARHFVELLDQPDLGHVWDLGGSVSTAGQWTMDALVAEARVHLGGDDPTVLDWGSGLDPGLALSGVAFTPPLESDTLPYLDHTIDLVMIRGDDINRVAEAKRVARLAVVEVAFASGSRTLQPEWLDDDHREPLSVEVLIVGRADALERAAWRVGRLLPRGVAVRVAESETIATEAARSDADVVALVDAKSLPLAGWLEQVVRLLYARPKSAAVRSSDCSVVAARTSALPPSASSIGGEGMDAIRSMVDALLASGARVDEEAAVITVPLTEVEV
jgi:GT2 family glycosyltransferase